MLSFLKRNDIKIGYLLNVIRLVSAALVFIIISPYINRTLGASNVGKIEYTVTIINYFLIFSALGIPIYGVRAIARCKGDEKLRSKTTLELLVILLCTSFVSYLVLIVLYYLRLFDGYESLIFVLSMMIALTNIGGEWYFLGKEDHLYITIRYLLIRILSVLLIFFLVKKSDDIILYAICLVVLNTGGNLLNIFVIAREELKIGEFKYRDLEFKKHLRPALTLFVATVSVNIYLQLDYFLLGYYTTNENVGYYSVANRLLRYAITFITVIGVVALPRLSNLYLKDKIAYFHLQEKLINYLLIISVPAFIYFFWFSDAIIGFMGGPEFSSATFTLKLLSPLCVVVSVAYILGFLVLYPQSKEHIYTISVVATALFSIIANILSIEKYKENGAAIVAVLSETLAIIIMLILIRIKKIPFKVDILNICKVFSASAIVFVFFAVGFQHIKDDVTRILFGILLLFTYFIVLVIVREKEIVNSIQFFKSKEK